MLLTAPLSSNSVVSWDADDALVDNNDVVVLNFESVLKSDTFDILVLSWSSDFEMYFLTSWNISGDAYWTERPGFIENKSKKERKKEWKKKRKERKEETF